jgi:hypothetical protein
LRRPDDRLVLVERRVEHVQPGQAGARRRPDVGRLAELEMAAEDVAGDEIGWPQNARREDVPRLGQDGSLSAWDEVLAQDIPTEAKLPDRCHLRRPTGREAAADALTVEAPVSVTFHHEAVQWRHTHAPGAAGRQRRAAVEVKDRATDPGVERGDPQHRPRARLAATAAGEQEQQRARGENRTGPASMTAAAAGSAAPQPNATRGRSSCGHRRRVGRSPSSIALDEIQTADLRSPLHPTTTASRSITVERGLSRPDSAAGAADGSAFNRRHGVSIEPASIRVYDPPLTVQDRIREFYDREGWDLCRESLSKIVTVKAEVLDLGFWDGYPN